jgi:hypothetical protein
MPATQLFVSSDFHRNDDRSVELSGWPAWITPPALPLIARYSVKIAQTKWFAALPSPNFIP